MPLVADIHFLPSAALVAAEQVEKVRINPGNWNERGGEFDELLSACRRRGVALRIGVNHGSLSPSIMERYGDTVEGMVASAMEYLRRCREASFGQVVVSIKSSNVRVMVQAYRMLVAAMRREGMRYPLHLGVTEAGDDREGRVKSAVGIGALLCDGIGDTIRVSLTEAPEREIPVARTLAGYFAGPREPRADPRCGRVAVQPLRVPPPHVGRDGRHRRQPSARHCERDTRGGPLPAIRGPRRRYRLYSRRTGRAALDRQPQRRGRAAGVLSENDRKRQDESRRDPPHVRRARCRSATSQGRRRLGTAAARRLRRRHLDRKPQRSRRAGRDRRDEPRDPASRPRESVESRVHRLSELRAHALRHRADPLGDQGPHVPPARHPGSA